MASRRADQVLALIRARPGITQDELAVELFGARGYPALVRRECADLVKAGLVTMAGYGVRGRPYAYSPAAHGRAS